MRNKLLTKTTSLLPGIKGNLNTIQVMKRVAHQRAGHPLVRKLALNIINYYNCDSHNYLDESKAIGNFVKQKVRYVKDPTGIEQLHDPIMLIDQIEQGIARGDCDDMALLIASLLLSIGHQPAFRTVRYKQNSGGYNHIYVIDCAHNKGGKNVRIALDAIVKNKPIGFEVPHKSGDDYKV